MSVDLKTIKACKKGKRKAIERLYKDCAGWMLGIVRRYEYDRNEAMSIVNTAMMAVVNSLPSFDETRVESIEAWIKTILIRKVIDYQRAKEREAQVIELNSDHEALSHTDSTDQLSRLNDLKMLINSLPTKTRTVFNLYAIEGYKHREIAELLGISEGTSKWHLNEARTKLQEKLEQSELVDKNMSI